MNKKIYEKFIKDKKKYIIIIIFILGFGIALNSLSPYIFGKTIDVVLLKQRSLFWFWIVLYAIVLLLVQVCLVIESLSKKWIITLIAKDMKLSFVKHVVGLETQSIDKYDTGELLNHTESDIETIADYYISMINNFLIVVLNLIVHNI